MNAVIKVLIGLREAKGWTAQQLAEESKVSHSQISRYERGERLPSANSIKKLADALDCTIDFLYQRGPKYSTFRSAAQHMSFDVFCSEVSTDPAAREKCSRVLNDSDAPTTAKEWRRLARLVAVILLHEPKGSAERDLRIVAKSEPSDNDH